MEEELKILEDFIKYYEAEAISRKFRGTLSISVDEQDVQALENLLTRYKEQEKRIIHLTNLLCIGDSDENYIPKSKVKEEIEELKEIADEDNLDEFIKIRALQELLEEE